MPVGYIQIDPEVAQRLEQRALDAEKRVGARDKILRVVNSLNGEITDSLNAGGGVVGKEQKLKVFSDLLEHSQQQLSSQKVVDKDSEFLASVKGEKTVEKLITKLELIRDFCETKNKEIAEENNKDMEHVYEADFHRHAIRNNKYAFDDNNPPPSAFRGPPSNILPS